MFLFSSHELSGVVYPATHIKKFRLEPLSLVLESRRARLGSYLGVVDGPVLHAEVLQRDLLGLDFSPAENEYHVRRACVGMNAVDYLMPAAYLLGRKA